MKNSYVDLILHEMSGVCRGQQLIADLLQTIQEKATHYCDTTGQSPDVALNAVLKLDEGAIQKVHPACTHICKHAVGACVLVQGHSVDDPELQYMADKAQNYVDLLSVTSELPPELVHTKLLEFTQVRTDS